jgi:hypothetical protein
METVFRDKFSENIRVSAIFSHQAHREECNSYFHKAFSDFYFYLGAFGWVQSQCRQSARLFLQSSELGLTNPNPHPQASVSPSLVPGGLAGEGGGPNSDEGTYSGALGVYVLCLCNYNSPKSLW